MLKFHLVLIISLFLLSTSINAQEANALNKHPILKFITENPERSAIQVVRNDTVLASHNSDQLIPLASTVKIILAIEYAVQAAEGKINPDQMIALSELNQFYAANTDGGAHPGWLQMSQASIKNDSIPLREVAKGMIMFSSNANTEWLLAKLGSDNVNQRIEKLGIEKHTEIYPIVSALYVGKESFPELKGDQLAAAINNISLKEYIAAIYRIHEKLKSDPDYKKDPGDLNMQVQKEWSDRLPASTVREYAGLMKKLNSKSYLEAETHVYLDEVMEGLMRSPANQQWLKHAGMKGGSTAFVLTKASYATDKKGNKTEIAYFLFDLEINENFMLQQQMNGFELKILTDGGFRDNLKARFE